MPPASNPPVRLKQPVANGGLHEADGRDFSLLLQVGRMAANTVSHLYPLMDQHDKYVAAYRSQEGQTVLGHLTCLMYSYWERSPMGASVFQTAIDHFPPSHVNLCRQECRDWGRHRVNSQPSQSLFLVDDDNLGTIVTDEACSTFYRVLGLMTSPGSALKRSNIKLPARAKITALPFRGVLVYDGLISPAIMAETLKAPDVSRVQAAYERAKAENAIVTGFHVRSCEPLPDPPSQTSLRDMSDKQIREFLQLRDVPVPNTPTRLALLSLATKARERMPREKYTYKDADTISDENLKLTEDDLNDVEKSMVKRMKECKKMSQLTCRRLGYTEADNPNHMMAFITPEGKAVACLKSKEVVPTVTEVVEELFKLAEKPNVLPQMIAIDDHTLATEMNRLTQLGGITTGFYPVPSVEERSLMSVIPAQVFKALSNYGGKL